MFGECLAVLTASLVILATYFVKKYVLPSSHVRLPPPRTVKEFEKLAESTLPESHWTFYSCGAGEDITLKNNATAFDRYLIRPRYLRDVSDIDMRVTVFGDEMAFPIGVSPTSFHALAHPEGETATARACVQMGTCMMLSSFSSFKMEDVAKSVERRGTLWYCMKPSMSDKVCKEHVSRADNSGYKAFVITIDNTIPGKRKRRKLPSNIKMDNFKKPPAMTRNEFFNTTVNTSITWKRLDWFRSLTQLPILVKGILTSEDATEAIKHDIQGIIVSNHGGRQLDGVPASIDVLGEVVSAVDNKVDVFIDGGIRKGTDILKALALGAKAVFLGRATLWGLAYDGTEGVKSVLTLLRDELKLAMQLSGCANLSDVRNNNVVVHESHYHNHGCHRKPDVV